MHSGLLPFSANPMSLNACSHHTLRADHTISALSSDLLDWIKFVFILAAEIIQVSDSIPWPGSVVPLAMLLLLISNISSNQICISFQCTTTWFVSKVASLALVPILASRWGTWIGCKCGHQMAPLALVVDLIDSRCFLNKLHVWPPSGDTCISFSFCHQVAPLALPHCPGLPYWHH